MLVCPYLGNKRVFRSYHLCSAELSKSFSLFFHFIRTFLFTSQFAIFFIATLHAYLNFLIFFNGICTKLMFPIFINYIHLHFRYFWLFYDEISDLNAQIFPFTTQFEMPVLTISFIFTSEEKMCVHIISLRWMTLLRMYKGKILVLCI